MSYHYIPEILVAPWIDPHEMCFLVSSSLNDPSGLSSLCSFWRCFCSKNFSNPCYFFSIFKDTQHY